MGKGIDRDNYVTIMGWMVTDLHLKGNELLIYAIIYGFCQDEGKCYSGSISYLREWFGLSYRGTLNILQALIEREYVIRDDTSGTPTYTAVVPCEKSSHGCEKNSHAIVKKVHTAPEKSSHNIDNDIDSLEIDKEKDTKVSQKKEIKNEPVRFIPPTIDQVREYCLSRQNAVDPETFVDFYQSKGWLVGKVKMKDWKAAVRTWERERGRRAVSPDKPSKFGQAIQMLHDMGINDNNSAF